MSSGAGLCLHSCFWSQFSCALHSDHAELCLMPHDQVAVPCSLCMYYHLLVVALCWSAACSFPFKATLLRGAPCLLPGILCSSAGIPQSLRHQRPSVSSRGVGSWAAGLHQQSMYSTPGRHPGNISGKKWVKQNKIKECVERIAAFEVAVWASVLKVGVHAKKRGQHWRE